MFGLICLIFCSTNFILAKVSDISEQLDNLEFELKGFEEEEATDPVFDELLYNTPILEKLGAMITTDLQAKVTGLLNVAETMDIKDIINLNAVMAHCRYVYTGFFKQGVVGLVISGLVSQIPLVSEVVDAAKLVGSTVQVSCSKKTKACDVVQHTGSQAAATTANAAWTFGTLFIGPLIGYVVGGVTDLVADADLPNAQACVACYLSSIMARNIWDNAAMSLTHKGNSDEAILYKFPSTTLTFGECKFNVQKNNPAGTFAANYIHSRMKAMFKIDKGAHTAADWLKSPGTTTKKLFENLSSTNEFQNAVREAGVPVIQFLAKKFWLVIKKRAAEATDFHNSQESVIGSKHLMVRYNVAVFDGWTK